MPKVVSDIRQEPEERKIVSNTDDDVFGRIRVFAQDSQKVIEEHITEWESGIDMYESVFDTSEGGANERYNPLLLYNVIQRVIDGLRLAPYILRIPEVDESDRQITRDMITQIMQDSGLVSELRDDDRGGLSWALLGNVVLWFGKSSEAEIKNGIPMKAKAIRLTQAFFNSSAIRLRDYNGEPEVNECGIMIERTYEQMLEKYPVGKRETDAFTGAEFDWGDVPIFESNDNVQNKRDDQTEEYENRITQELHYYNLERGIYEVRVGREATIVERYDDNDSTVPDYPYVLKDRDKKGQNYIPVELLKFSPVIGELYAKGCYHLYAKLARMDSMTKNLAYSWIERNIYPDKFVKMKSGRFTRFQTEVDLARQSISEGRDSYIQLDLNEEVQVGDLRQNGLTQEFERINESISRVVSNSGVALEDVDRPVSESATATAAEERAKGRLTDHVVKINASASKFLVRVILQFVKDYITKNNKTPIATNVKVKKKEASPEIMKQVDAMRQGGAPEEELDSFLNQNSEETQEETTLEGITMGDWVEFMKDKTIYVQEDFSAWNDVDYKMRLMQKALPFAAGTQAQARITQNILSSLGVDVLAQELSPQQETIDATNAQTNLQNAQQGVAQNMELPQTQEAIV
jgi:hypothetical protein